VTPAGVRRSALAVFALAAACVACGGGSSLGGSGPDAGADDTGVVAVTTEARCEALCNRLGKLQCPAPSTTWCKDDCMLRQSFAPWCDGAGLAAVDCLTIQPDSSFVCGATGAEPKSDVCKGEQRAFENCLYKGPLPDMTQDCTAYSNLFSSLVSSLGCGQPLTRDQCLSALSDPIPCNGALAIYIHCNAREPASSFQCTEGGPAPKPNARCAPYAIPLVSCIQPQP
jgi:hypothetical protein